MAAIITEKFRLQNASQFAESFSETNEHFYMFLGKATPFTSTTSGGSDTSPPTPVDDITSENYRWDSMIGLNKTYLNHKRVLTTFVTKISCI